MRNRPPEFHFPIGSIVYTGWMRDEKSFEQYKGHEYQRIGVEEASQIPTREPYLMLLASNRSTVPDLKPKVALTSNPDGPLHDFLKKRFVKVYAPDGTLIPWKTPFRDPIEKRIRIYIPGTKEDNQILLKADPLYYERMNNLPEYLRRAWVEGDWEAQMSAMFPEFRPYGPVIGNDGMEPDEARHVVPEFRLPAWCHRWAALDWGHSHHTAVLWAANAPDHRVHVYREFLVRKIGNDEIGAEVAKRCIPDLEEHPDHHLILYLSRDCFSVRDRDKTIAEQIKFGIDTILGPDAAFVLAFSRDEAELSKEQPDAALELMLRRRTEVGNRMCITLRMSNPDRVAGWGYVRRMLRWKKIRPLVKPDMEYARRLIEGPMGYVKYHQYLDLFNNERPEVVPGVIIHDSCPVLIETIPRLLIDKDKPEDALKFNASDDEFGDDVLDCWRTLLMAHQQHESKVPYPVWIEQELEKVLPAGAGGDINLRIQAAMKAEERYKKLHPQARPMLLPRECLAMRQ
jgi:hypothetical protein